MKWGRYTFKDLWGARPGPGHTVHVQCAPFQPRARPPHGPGGGGRGAGATGPACCEVRIEGTRLHPVCACSGRWHRGGIRVFTPERWAPQQSFATPSPDQRDVHCVFTCKGTPVHFYIIVKLLLLCYLFVFFACLKSLDFCGGG